MLPHVRQDRELRRLRSARRDRHVPERTRARRPAATSAQATAVAASVAIDVLRRRRRRLHDHARRAVHRDDASPTGRSSSPTSPALRARSSFSTPGVIFGIGGGSHTLSDVHLLLTKPFSVAARGRRVRDPGGRRRLRRERTPRRRPARRSPRRASPSRASTSRSSASSPSRADRPGRGRRPPRRVDPAALPEPSATRAGGGRPGRRMHLARSDRDGAALGCRLVRPRRQHGHRSAPLDAGPRRARRRRPRSAPRCRSPYCSDRTSPRSPSPTRRAASGSTRPA